MFKKYKKFDRNERFECSSPGKAVELMPFDELLFKEGVRQSDISLYMHQQTLDEFDASQIREYIDKMTLVPNAQDIFKDVSDEKLLQACKSRRCSDFADMKNYIDYLALQSSMARAELQSLQESEKKENAIVETFKKLFSSDKKADKANS